MSWIIRFRGIETSSDAFTLDELEAVEKSSGTPWSVLNPYRELGVAKAMLAVILVREGVRDADIPKELSTLTLGDIKSTFEWKSDDEGDKDEDEDDDAAPLARPHPISRSSSPGASSGTTGPRKKRANSA